jgi:hypothetical protein
MRKLCVAVAAISTTLAASSISAQTPDPAAPAAAPAPAPVGEDWNPVSRSATRAYLVDVNTIKVDGAVTSVTLARVPLNPPTASDHSYTSVELEYRCRDKQARILAETDHDETGVALDRTDAGDEFAPYRDESLQGYVGGVACDGNRAPPPTFPSVAAFIEAGRPDAKS